MSGHEKTIIIVEKGKWITVHQTNCCEHRENIPQPEWEVCLKTKENTEQLEDRVMKTAAQYFGEDLLPYLGIKGRIRRIAPTEHIHLEARRLEEDFNFEMQDGSYRHLEFESDRISTKDLRRFREYEAFIGMSFDAPVSTIVICTANVKKRKTELVNGDSVFRIQVIYLKDRNGDRILRWLDKRRAKGKPIGAKRLLPLLLTPLMSGELPLEERICRGLDLLRCEEAGIEKDTRRKMETILYALAVKLLDGNTLEKVKEKFGMTLLGEMLVADGMRKGMQEGMQKGLQIKLISMVRKKMLRGYDPAQIADVLEEEPEKVEKICRIPKATGMISFFTEQWHRERRETGKASLRSVALLLYQMRWLRGFDFPGCDFS